MLPVRRLIEGSENHGSENCGEIGYGQTKQRGSNKTCLRAIEEGLKGEGRLDRIIRKMSGG